MYVQLNGARLFFDTVGPKLAIDGPRLAERPTLIVMHGGPGFDHASLRPYFDRFADTHQVLYIDHRGNGRSSGAPETWTLAQWGDDVRALCDALGIEKPVVYGNSFGGMVAMAYAGRHPDHPGKLILSSTAARMRLDVTYDILESRGGAHARQLAERMFTATDADVFEEYTAVCLPFYNPRPNPESALARQRSIHRPEVAQHFFMGEMRTMDLRPGLAAINCPTLILAGGFDPITPPVCAEEVAASFVPGVAELCLFEGAGHGIHRDEPERTEEVLRRFLAAG